MGALQSTAFGAAVAVAWLALASAPLAASQPQALALISTNGTVELSCGDKECLAELSTFCLQPDRFSPPRGTAYWLAEGSDVRLIGTTAEGRKVDLDPARYLAFASARTHLAMTVRASREDLAALGVERVAIDVGERVALLPDGAGEAVERDLIADVLRPLGSEIVDRDGERMVAARVTNRLINGLAVESSPTADRRESLWGDSVAGLNGGDATNAGVDLARGAFDMCAYVVDRGSMRSMRRCLERHHDGFLNYLNSRYWKAVKTGS